MSPKEAHDFVDGIIDDEDPIQLRVSSEVHDAIADGGPAHGAIRYRDVNIYRDASLDTFDYY